MGENINIGNGINLVVRLNLILKYIQDFGRIFHLYWFIRHIYNRISAEKSRLWLHTENFKFRRFSVNGKETLVSCIVPRKYTKTTFFQTPKDKENFLFSYAASAYPGTENLIVHAVRVRIQQKRK